MGRFLLTLILAMTASSAAARAQSDPVCSLVGPLFGIADKASSDASAASANAGMNAKGLSFFSPGNHFKTVEDDYKAAMDATNLGLDTVVDATVKLDGAAAGATKDTAVEMASAYEKNLKYIRNYAQLAVGYERAVNSKNLAESAALTWSVQNVYSPSITSAVGSAVQGQDAQTRRLSADQARTVLEAENENVKDGKRALALPKLHWQKACGSPQP